MEDCGGGLGGFGLPVLKNISLFLCCLGQGSKHDKHQAKEQLREERVTGQELKESQTGAQGRNLGAGTDAEAMTEHCSLAFFP